MPIELASQEIFGPNTCESHVIVNHDESELLKKHEPLKMNRIKTSDQKRHRIDE